MNRLKEKLLEKGKDEQWLAERLGVNIFLVLEWSNNKKDPGLNTLFKIAELLDVDPADLYQSEGS